jgi:hypothetical protein
MYDMLDGIGCAIIGAVVFGIILGIGLYHLAIWIFTHLHITWI